MIIVYCPNCPKGAQNAKRPFSV